MATLMWTLHWCMYDRLSRQTCVSPDAQWPYAVHNTHVGSGRGGSQTRAVRLQNLVDTGLARRWAHGRFYFAGGGLT